MTEPVVGLPRCLRGGASSAGPAMLSPIEAWLGLHALAKGSHLWGASAPDSALH